MHRVRDEADPSSSALAVPAAAPTACGYPAVAWELGPARLHVGWTWCLDCFPDRAGEGAARSRLDPFAPTATQGALLREHAAKATRKDKEIERIRRKVARELARRQGPLRYCYCPKCAGGWPSRDETIRELRSIQRKPQGWNPR
jgi:hypothetical protein